MAIESDNEATRRIMAASNRLRVVQADFADDEDSVRKEFLLEEIDRALAAVIPDDRKEFLEQLQDRFPSWDVGDVKPLKTSPGPAGVDPRKLSDWTFLVDKLAEAGSTMSAVDKQAATDKLRAVGIIPPEAVYAGGGWPAPPATLSTKFQLGFQEKISPARMYELLEMLTELVNGLDQLAWNIWKQVASQSNTKRSSPLQRVFARFISGDPEMPRGVAAAEIGRLRTLLAAMISSVGQLGRRFGQDFGGQFSPVQIEDMVKAQQGGAGMFGVAKSKLWEQFVKMSGSLDPAAIEHQFVELFTDYVEQLMRTK